jgi:chaperonin GroES
MSKRFRPLHDRVVVKRVVADQKTSGGIIIPDTAQGEALRKAKLSAVGPGGRDESRQARRSRREGRRSQVLFGKWSGTEVKIDGEDLLIMKESDIMGVITKK